MPEPNSSISSFKQFLLKILLPLILIIGAGGYVFNYLFEQQIVFKSQGCGAYKVNRILYTTTPDEIPIFGSSRAEGSLLPDSIGKNYFNYGISATKYNVTLFFLEQECMKKKNTPWIIMNLDLNGLEYGPGDLSNYIPNSGCEPVRSLLDTYYMSYFRIPFIRYYGCFETYLRSNMNDKLELTKVKNKGASIEKNIIPKEQFAEMIRIRKMTTTEFAYDTVLSGKLFSLIATNSARKFLFLISPYQSSFFYKFENPEDASRLLDSLRTYPNVKVLDFSKMPLPDSMFLNTSHLNFRGTVVFNRVLRDSLNAIGVK